MSLHSYLTKALGKIARNSSASSPSRNASRGTYSTAQEERERQEAERRERERQEAERRERERQEAEQRIREPQAGGGFVRHRDAQDIVMAAHNPEDPEYERMARISSLVKSGATPANEDEIDEVNFIRKKMVGPSYGTGTTFEDAYAAWNTPNSLEVFADSTDDRAVRGVFGKAGEVFDESLSSSVADSMKRARAAERQGPNSSMVTAKKAADKMDEISYAAQVRARHLLGVEGEPGDSDLFSRPGAALLDAGVGMIPGTIGQFPRAVETGLGLMEGYSLDDDYRVKPRDTAQAAAEFAEPAIDVGSMFLSGGLGSKAVKELGKAAAKKSGVAEVAKAMGKGSAVEMPTEMVQEVLGGLSEGEAPTGRDLASAGLLGGIMGPGFAGTGAAVTKVAQKARERKAHTDTGVDLPSVAKDASLDASGLIDVTGETPSAPKGLEAMYRDSLVSPEESVAPVQEAATAVDPAAQMTPMNAPEAPVAPVTPQVPVDASTTVVPQAEVAARTQVAPEQAEVSPALSPMSEVATEAAPLAETISPETVKAAEATPTPVALASEVQTKEAAPLKTEESSSRTVEPGQGRGRFRLAEVVQQLKKSPETVSRTDLESVVDPLAEEAVEALHSELPKGIEVDRAIDTVADAWIEALKKDPESFSKSPGRIKRKLNQGETSAANILKEETKAQAPTEAAAKTETEPSEKTEPKSKEKAPEKEQKTETKNKEKEKDSGAERKETPAEKEAETESKESESEKTEESATGASEEQSETADSQQQARDDSNYTKTSRRVMAENAAIDSALREKGFGKKKSTRAIKEMRKEAEAKYGQMTSAELTREWAIYSGEISGDEGVVDAGTAFDRAMQLEDYDLAASIHEKIVNETTIEGTSGAGRALRLLREFTGNRMTPEMRQTTTLNHVNRARKEAGLDPLNDEQAATLRAAVQNAIDARKSVDAATNKVIDALGKLDDGGEVNITEAQNLAEQYADADAEAGFIVGETNETITELLPPEKADSKLANYMRASMLSNPFGRVRDILQTKGAAGLMRADATVTAIINAGIQKITGKHMDLPTSVYANSRTGAKQGWKRAKNAARGRLSSRTIIGTERKRSNLAATNKVEKAIAGSTEIATHLVEGLTTSRAYALAEAKNRAKGFTGDELAVRATLDAVSDPAIVKEAENYGFRASYIHDNPVTDFFKEFARAIEKVKYIGKPLRNMIIPFTNVSGGLVHEAATKRNVVANGIGMINAGIKGDVNAFTENFGRLLVNGGLGPAGYLLASSGLIATEDANGDDYDGLYLHLGDYFIPLNQLPGMMGVSLMVGAAFYDEAIAENIYANIKAVGGMADMSIGSSPAMQLFDSGPLTGSFEKLLASIISPFIPAAFTAVNATTDFFFYQLTGNDRALETRVTRMNDEGREVTDQLRTQANKLMSRIPGLREVLPRTSDKTVRNPLDVITTGNHTRAGETPESQKDRTVTESSHDWYDIKKNIDTDEMTIVRKDGEKPMYQGDIEGGDFSSSELKYLSMTETELQRDKEGDRWKNVVDFYKAEKKALENELRLAQESYDEGMFSLKDLKAVEDKIDANVDNGNIADVNKNVLENNKELLEMAGVTSAYELMELYHETNLTEWRALSDDDPMKAALKEYDLRRTEKKVSDKKGDKLSEKYYDKSSSPRKGGSRGGGGGSATSLHVPSLSDLKTELYAPKGNKEISSSTVKTKGTVAPVSLKAKKTIRSGSGIKTEPKNFQGAKTIKYEKSKTRQPAMGTPYMEYLKGQTTQDTFKAARRYV